MILSWIITVSLGFLLGIIIKRWDIKMNKKLEKEKLIRENELETLRNTMDIFYLRLSDQDYRQCCNSLIAEGELVRMFNEKKYYLAGTSRNGTKVFLRNMENILTNTENKDE